MIEYKKGDRVIHAEHGKGMVIKDRSGGATVRVMLDSGREWISDCSNIKRDADYKSTTDLKSLSEQYSLNKWQFTSVSEYDVDWKLIAADLTNKNPLALIKIGDYNYIVVHHQFAKKAKVLNICTPDRDIVSKEPLVYITTTQFSEWIDWAKQVRRSKWKVQDKQTVTVILPNV